MKIIKKSTIFLIFIAFVITISNINIDASYKLPFELKSKCAYMVNTDTNTVIYEKNANEKIYPASLTKIMTAILAIENIPDLEGTVVTAPSYVYNEFAGIGVSTADIRAGESVRMIDLLYAMLLQSACEASNIIADYVGEGNITEFIEMMNDKAKEIGAVNTNFENPHGLFHEDQISTAYDLYLITKYALSLPIFEKIVTSPSYLMPATNKHPQERYVIHTNHMLSKTRGGSLYYPHVKGIKTGSLPEVGKNLITMASKEGYNYILVTIGAPVMDSEGKPFPQNQAFLDTKNMYEWAFNNFSQQTVIKEGEIVTEANLSLATKQDYVTLIAKKDVLTLLPNEVKPSALQRNCTVKQNLVAPVKKGDVLGKLELKLADETIASVDLVAIEDVDRNIYLYAIDVTKRFLSKPTVKYMLIALLALILLYIIYAIRYNILKKKSQTHVRSYKSFRK